jgi:CHAT domain-containing protein
VAHRRDREQAAADLRACVNAIRQQPGYENFLRPLTAGEVGAAASSGPIVYLVVTSAGGLALIVTATGVEPIPLPCTAEEVRGWIQAPGSDGQPGYLAEVLEGGPGLQGSLGPLLSLLGERLMRPVADSLRAAASPCSGRPSVHLVPTGLLALLPLHAASYKTPQGATAFLDEFTVSYLPTVRVLSVVQRPPGSLFLAVGDPAPQPVDLAALPFARSEAALAAARHPSSRALLGGDATGAAVRAVWDRADATHLACHGFFDARAPLASALVLAGGERLTLAEVTAGLSKGRGPRRVVLSACQTALADFHDLPEEVIGFPGGLLQAGASTVVGTLWPVSDWSTALLMDRFYEGTQRGAGTAEALRAAQTWLRSLFAAEVASSAERAYRAAGPREQVALLMAWRHYHRRAERDPTERPFEAPFFWAGFACWGAARE